MNAKQLNQCAYIFALVVLFPMTFVGAFIRQPVLTAGGLIAMLALIGGVVWMNERAWRRLKSEKIKMYCICSKEALDQMKGIRGKMITQGGHAYLHAFWDAEDRFPDLARAYRETSHAYKITLVVPTEADLQRLMDSYRDVCGVSLVKDAGFTVFKNEDGSPKPTVTYLGLGPITESMIKEDLAPKTGPKPLT